MVVVFRVQYLARAWLFIILLQLIYFQLFYYNVKWCVSKAFIISKSKIINVDIYISLWKSKNRNKIIEQLFRRLSLQIGRSILIRTFELKIGNPRTPGDLFIGERTPGPGFLSSFRSLDASSVLSRIQFGHCPWFYLQRGITIAVVYGWTALDVRGTGRQPLALILYRTLYPRSLPRPVSSSHQLPPPSSSTSSTLGRAGIFNSFECRGESSLLEACCSSVLSGSWNQQERLRRRC